MKYLKLRSDVSRISYPVALSAIGYPFRHTAVVTNSIQSLVKAVTHEPT